MPSIYGLKPRFQQLLRPASNALATAGVSPNQVTLAALAISFATGATIFHFRNFRALVLLPVVLFLRMALNAIDGMLAREHNQKTPLGAVLNELGDAFSDSVLYLPLAVVPGFSPTAVTVAVLLAILTEMTGVVAVQIGASRRYDGPMGKSDRAFVFGALGLLLALRASIASAIPYILWIVVALLLFTIFNRARRALAELQGTTPR